MPPRKKQEEPERISVRRPLTFSEAIAQISARKLSRRSHSKIGP